jgi:hypothetical protein
MQAMCHRNNLSLLYYKPRLVFNICASIICSFHRHSSPLCLHALPYPLYYLLYIKKRPIPIDKVLKSSHTASILFILGKLREPALYKSPSKHLAWVYLISQDSCQIPANKKPVVSSLPRYNGGANQQQSGPSAFTI